MRLYELRPELAEQAKQCTTREERLAFIRDNEIELTDEQLELINGGHAPVHFANQGHCNESPNGYHSFARTGKKTPGAIFGDLWPNYETKCQYCGLISSEFAW